MIIHVHCFQDVHALYFFLILINRYGFIFLWIIFYFLDFFFKKKKGFNRWINLEESGKCNCLSSLTLTSLSGIWEGWVPLSHDLCKTVKNLQLNSMELGKSKKITSLAKDTIE